jgi:hypothetical protein
MEARSVSFIIVMFLLPTLAHAQKEMATDRPDQTETSSVVPAGWLQIEAGISRNVLRFSTGSFDFLKETEYAVPDVLFRLGMNEHFEIRFGLGYSYLDHRSDFSHLSDEHAIHPPLSFTNDGFLPISAGLKTTLNSERGPLPEAAFIFMLAFPGSGAEAFDIEGLASEARLACSHTLGERFSLGYNLGLGWDGSSASYNGLYSVALGASLGEPFGAYVEVYGDVMQQQSPVHRMDGGLTWLATPDLQIDLSAGYTLKPPHRNFDRDETEYYLAVGCSFRVMMWDSD